MSAYGWNPNRVTRGKPQPVRVPKQVVTNQDPEYEQDDADLELQDPVRAEIRTAPAWIRLECDFRTGSIRLSIDFDEAEWLYEALGELLSKEAR